MMINMWTSVRPMRFRKQIFDALEFIVQRGHIDISELAEKMLDLRRSRDGIILSSTRMRRAIGQRTKGGKQQYLTLTEQFIRIFKSVSLVTENNKIITSTSFAGELVNRHRQDEFDGERIFLEILLNSRYKTYMLYLKQLFESKRIFIPNILSKRDAKLRSYIESIGFPLTAWSFYILRDFFYEFGLINFIKDEKGEEIFPLYSLNSENKNNFELAIKTVNGSLYYWKKVELSNFKTNLMRAYIDNNKNWNTMMELVRLREIVSIAMQISERQFNKLLSEIMLIKTNVQIYLSIGTIRPLNKKGYLMKLQSLPTSKRGYPLTLIRLSPRENVS